MPGVSKARPLGVVVLATRRHVGKVQQVRFRRRFQQLVGRRRRRPLEDNRVAFDWLRAAGDGSVEQVSAVVDLTGGQRVLEDGVR